MTAPPLSPSDPATEAHVHHLFATHIPRSPIYAFLLAPAPAVHHASPGRVVVRLVLRAAHLNGSGSVHGGALATLVDWAGGLAIASHDARERTGVSVDIHVAYLAGAREGDTLEIDARADRVGGSVAFSSVDVYRLDAGGARVPVAMGRHTKFVRGSAPKPAVEGGAAANETTS
jgi:acyl-coenzyme A thioesterase 13